MMLERGHPQVLTLIPSICHCRALLSNSVLSGLRHAKRSLISDCRFFSGGQKKPWKKTEKTVQETIGFGRKKRKKKSKKSVSYQKKGAWPTKKSVSVYDNNSGH